VDEKNQANKKRKPVALRVKPFAQQSKKQDHGKSVQEYIDEMARFWFFTEELYFNGKRSQCNWPVGVTCTVVIEECPRPENFRNSLNSFLCEFVGPRSVKFIVEGITIEYAIAINEKNETEKHGSKAVSPEKSSFGTTSDRRAFSSCWTGGF
jgi:hypothetical protein